MKKSTKTFEMKKTIQKIKEVEFPFSASVKLGNEVYKADGATPEDAILALKPPKVSARAIFGLEHEGRKSQLQKNVWYARRALQTRLVAYYLGKNLKMLLK